MRFFAPESHPSRGAWIEIGVPPDTTSTVGGRTPHGVRGLKYPRQRQDHYEGRSHPSRGAWIEIRASAYWCASRRRTPHGVRGLKFVQDMSDFPPL